MASTSWRCVCEPRHRPARDPRRDDDDERDMASSLGVHSVGHAAAPHDGSGGLLPKSPRTCGTVSATVPEQLVFHGAVFALSASGTNQGELQKLIERHGGSVSRTVHKKVDVLVVSQKAMQRNTQHVRKARDKFGIPLVLPNFVHESLSHGEWLATEDYAPSVASTASASASNAATKFKWRRAIRQALRAAPEQTLQLKSLRQQVLAEFGGDAWASLAGADAKRLFRKKLKKVDGLILDGKVVRLMYLC